MNDVQKGRDGREGGCFFAPPTTDFIIVTVIGASEYMSDLIQINS